MNVCQEIAEISSERASLYRLLATLYFKPLDNEQIEAIADCASGEAESDESPFAEAFRDIYGALRLRHTGTREILGADFTAVFYGTKTIDERTAMPYESLHDQSCGRFMGQARGEVVHILKAAGLKVPQNIDLPEDHLSFICAYLALTCDEQERQARAGNLDELRKVSADQNLFFEKHLQSWVPSFAKYARRFVETRFYRGVLELTEIFVKEEDATQQDILKALEVA